jgi:hypothetical protein
MHSGMTLLLVYVHQCYSIKRSGINPIKKQMEARRTLLPSDKYYTIA